MSGDLSSLYTYVPVGIILITMTLRFQVQSALPSAHHGPPRVAASMRTVWQVFQSVFLFESTLVGRLSQVSAVRDA